MKKLIFSLFLFLSLSIAARAQFVFGIKGGISSSNVDVKDLKNTFLQFKNKDNITGYHLGAFARLKALGLLLQPEGIFTSSGGKVEVMQTENGQEVKTTEDFTFNRLDVPVLVGINLLNTVRLQAGPVASVLVSGKFQDQNIKNYMDKTDLGWQAGIGLDIGNVTADVRYENVNRKYTNSAQNSSFKVGNQQVILSLGFKLIGK